MPKTNEATDTPTSSLATIGERVRVRGDSASWLANGSYREAGGYAISSLP